MGGETGREVPPADRIAFATRKASASGSASFVVKYVKPTAGRSLLPYSVTRASLLRGGSFMLTRGSGRDGFAIEAKYLSTQPSSCFGSKSPTTTSVALSGR